MPASVQHVRLHEAHVGVRRDDRVARGDERPDALDRCDVERLRFRRRRARRDRAASAKRIGRRQRPVEPQQRPLAGRQVERAGRALQRRAAVRERDAPDRDDAVAAQVVARGAGAQPCVAEGERDVAVRREQRRLGQVQVDRVGAHVDVRGKRGARRAAGRTQDGGSEQQDARAHRPSALAAPSAAGGTAPGTVADCTASESSRDPAARSRPDSGRPSCRPCRPDS